MGFNHTYSVWNSLLETMFVFYFNLCILDFQLATVVVIFGGFFEFFCVGAPNALESRRPGCRRSSALASSGGETQRRQSPFHPVRMVGLRVVLGRDARSFVPRRWAQGRGPQLGTDAAVQRADATTGWRTVGVCLGGHDTKSVKVARK